MTHSAISLGVGLGGGRSATSSGRLPSGGVFSNTLSGAFDGTDDYLNPSDTFSTLFGGTFGISVWYKTPSSFTGVDGMIISNFFASNTGNVELRITGTSSSAAKVSLWHSTAITLSPPYNAYGKETGDTALSTNTWYHLCWATDRPVSGTTSSKLYINGSEATISVGAYGQGTLDNASTFTTNSFILFGSRNGAASGAGSTTHALPGNLDELAFFNSALSASDVTNIYNSPAKVPNDLGPAGLNLSPVGWWRMGDGTGDTNSGGGTPASGDTIGTVVDQGSGSNNASTGGAPTYSSTVP